MRGADGSGLASGWRRSLRRMLYPLSRADKAETWSIARPPARGVRLAARLAAGGEACGVALGERQHRLGRLLGLGGAVHGQPERQRAPQPRERLGVDGG